MISKKPISILLFAAPAAIFFLNLIIKSLYIESNDIVLDESFSIFYAQWSINEMIEILTYYNNPPLHEIILHYWIKVFGIEPLAVRFPSMIFSSLTAVVIYKTALKFINLKTALFSAMLFTLSTYHLYFAHEARVYALFAFLTSLSIYYYFSLAKNIKARKYFYLLLLTNLILTYSHYFGIIVVGIEFIFSVFKKDQNRKLFLKILINDILLFLLYLPILFIMLDRFTGSAVHGTWVTEPQLDALYENIRKFSNAPVLASVFLILLFSAVVKFFIGKEKSTFYISGFATFFLLPYILMFIVSFAIPIYNDRYLIFTTIPFYILIGISVNYLFSNKLISYCLIAVLILGMLFTIDLKPSLNRDTKALSAYLKEIKKENSVIILTPYWIDKVIMYHYNQEYFKDYKNLRKLMESENIYSTNEPVHVKKILRKNFSTIIYVQGMSELVDPENLIFNIIEENSIRYEKNTDFSGKTVTIFYN